MKRLSIKEIHKGFRAKEFSPTEFVKEYTKDIKKKNDSYNAFLAILEEKAVLDAEAVEKRLMSGEDIRVLEGIPVSYKDFIHTKGIPTTYGGEIDRHHVPEDNASVVVQLNQAGAVNVGKTNLHEYAFGITSNNPHYGPVRNPWNTEFTPGGSSGGSAAAVAANMSVVSIGTDTGGSIRIPSASCGLVGLKPTYDLLDSKGVFNISWSLDHIGPITANVEDNALVMKALTDTSYEEDLTTDIRGLRVGVPVNYFNERIESEVKAQFEESLKRLEKLGAILIDVDMSMANAALPHTFTLAGCEAVYIHKDRMERSIDQYGADVRGVLEASAEIKSVDYITALKERTNISQQVDNVFANIDVLVTPTVPAVTKPIGVEEVLFNGKPEPIFNCMIRYTSLFNITGHPAMSLPVGYSSDKLPIGIQLVGKKHREDLLFKASYAYEQHYLQPFYEERDRICIGEPVQF
ncbi:amidase [Bacillus thermotolerans]|uniref:amidase n=1 Tax=Bacillus thermotolerans TaxID=1221996 RepID=UPI00057D24A5|nr:amidase [Bacillus thermotolerans]KKB34000.1 Aspartyl-tRNA(Asn) amidotransferase subunit A [Bacillus thermotolerans]